MGARVRTTAGDSGSISRTVSMAKKRLASLTRPGLPAQVAERAQKMVSAQATKPGSLKTRRHAVARRQRMFAAELLTERLVVLWHRPMRTATATP